jgi:prefoldin subunit 5
VGSNRQIEFLARAIINRLEDRGLVEFGDAEEGIQLAVRALEKNIAEYEAIENEARQRLTKSLGRSPRREELEQEMQNVAAERGVAL